MSKTKINKTRQMKLTSWDFANSCGKIIEPLLSRFVVLKVPKYTFDEFTQIAVSILRKENIDEEIAVIIAEKVWHELGSRDIRDAKKVARLVSNEQDIYNIICIMKTRLRKVTE